MFVKLEQSGEDVRVIFPHPRHAAPANWHNIAVLHLFNIFVMAIPMGLVVTICMAMGVVFANRLPAGALNTRTPRVLLQIVGSVCLAAGLWNALWHGTRHLTQFWGQMAIGSGLVLCAVGMLLFLPAHRVPQSLETGRPFLVLLLACFAAVYGWTIYFLYFPS